MKKFLVTLRLSDQEVNLGIVEAGDELHAAETVGAVRNEPDPCTNTYAWSFRHRFPGDVNGGGTIKFYQMMDILSAHQFRGMVVRQQRLEESLPKTMTIGKQSEIIHCFFLNGAQHTVKEIDATSPGFVKAHCGASFPVSKVQNFDTDEGSRWCGDCIKELRSLLKT